MTVGGSAIGGFILTHFGTDHGAYMAVFAISGGVRILTIGLLVRAVRIIPVSKLPAEAVQLPIRVMAVRPQLGAIERPILSGMAAPDSADAAHQPGANAGSHRTSQATTSEP
jgi:hypothetical protein